VEPQDVVNLAIQRATLIPVTVTLVLHLRPEACEAVRPTAFAEALVQCAMNAARDAGNLPGCDLTHPFNIAGGLR
jgi:hypothetical protein